MKTKPNQTVEGPMFADDGLPVLKCWACNGESRHCIKCGGTGAIFWVGGYAFPYSPEGEIRARAELAKITR
jgi:hypothetical protein